MRKQFQGFSFNAGFQRAQVWQDDTGQWHYDGPASCGPRTVWTSGHGPSWRGPITRQFAVALRCKVAAAGLSISEH